jgi:hypothetical protein
MPQNIDEIIKKSGISKVEITGFKMLPVFVSLLDKMLRLKVRSGILLGSKQEKDNFLKLQTFQNKWAESLDFRINQQTLEEKGNHRANYLEKYFENPLELYIDTTEANNELTRVHETFHAYMQRFSENTLRPYIINQFLIDTVKNNWENYRVFLEDVNNFSSLEAASIAGNKAIEVKFLIDNIPIKIEDLENTQLEFEKEIEKINLGSVYTLDPYSLIESYFKGEEQEQVLLMKVSGDQLISLYNIIWLYNKKVIAELEKFLTKEDQVSE